MRSAFDLGRATANTIRFVWNHPLGARNRRSALGRWLRWQVVSRLLDGDAVVPFVTPARLLVRRGMTGATGNVYVGLHEFAEMAFLLHLLDNGSTFVDVGANVGSFTVLASAVCGARSIACEPIPATFAALEENIRLNAIESLVRAERVGVGAERSVLRFTTSRDTMNSVASPDTQEPTMDVIVQSLDELVGPVHPTLVKIDVEGHEGPVVRGATLALTAALAVIVEHAAAEPVHSEAHATLTRLGLTPYEYDPFDRQLRRLSQPRNGNTLYVRDAVVVAGRVQKAPRRQALGIEF